MSKQGKNPSIYIWYRPADEASIGQLTTDLLTAGFDIYKVPQNQLDQVSFHTVEWWLSKLDYVIFILSGNSVDSPELIEDIKIVLRKKGIVPIPVIIDHHGAKNIPVILKFIYPLDFRKNYDKMLGLLVNGLRQGVKSSNEFNKSSTHYFPAPFIGLANHFRSYMTLSPLTFCWKITVENLIISLSVTGLILFLLQPITRTNLENLSVSQFIWLVIILGPIFETLALQAFPVYLAQRLGLRFFGQITFSILPFAVLHFSRSIGAGIGAGIIGGFYSAFTYVHWQQKSIWTAFWVTALSHGLYNFAIFAMMIGEF